MAKSPIQTAIRHETGIRISDCHGTRFQAAHVHDPESGDAAHLLLRKSGPSSGITSATKR